MVGARPGRFLGVSVEYVEDGNGKAKSQGARQELSDHRIRVATTVISNAATVNGFALGAQFQDSTSISRNLGTGAQCGCQLPDADDTLGPCAPNLFPHGRWHHAIVEAETLTLYLNGRKEAAARGVNASVSLANDGDLHVGGTPDGRYLNGALADADTTIEGLYAW